MSVWSDWGEGAHRRAQGWGQGSAMEAATQPPNQDVQERHVGHCSPSTPGVPVGPNWHPGRGTSSTLRPDRSMPTAAPVPETRQRSIEQPPAATPSPRPLPWAHLHCDHSRGAGQQATCPAGRELPGGLGRAGLAEAGRAGLRRRRGQQGALQERLGHRAAGPQGKLPHAAPLRQRPSSRKPPPHPLGPAHAHQLTPRAESLSVGHLTLTPAAPGTGHRGFLPGPRLC